MKKDNKVLSKATMITAALKVAKAVLESGETEIQIKNLNNEMRISGIFGEEFDWSVLEKVAEITDKPPITWGVKKNDEDDLYIYLKNGAEDELQSDN